MDKEITADNNTDRYMNFIQMAAHDLQSPVRKLEVFMDRLMAQLSPTENAQLEKYSGRMRSCLAEIKSLVRGFENLATSLPETMHYSTCDTGLLLKNALADFTELSKEKSATITIENLPVIQGDKTQLEIVFKELLENAIRFSQPGVSLQMHISSERLSVTEKERFKLPGDHSYHKISFADNGIGLPATEAERIFDPLVRLHGKSEFPGNGLGLAIVKKIIENHRGRVYAENNNPEGLCVIVLIPENKG